MVEFGTSSAFRGWVRVRVLGYGFGVRGRKVKSRDCALASDLVRAASRSSTYKLMVYLCQNFARRCLARPLPPIAGRSPARIARGAAAAALQGNVKMGRIVSGQAKIN